MRIATIALALTAAGTALALAFGRAADDKAPPQQAPGTVQRAICVLAPRSDSQVSGIVRFVQRADGVQIEADLKGLKPGLHGFHVHEWGDLDCMDGKCTGGHFNPTGAAHGAPDDAARHAGDLGNVEAKADGTARYDRLDKMIHLNGADSIIGRGLIVHADPDDLKSQPTGNAGARIAAGVIGIADPGKK